MVSSLVIMQGRHHPLGFPNKIFPPCFIRQVVSPHPVVGPECHPPEDPEESHCEDPHCAGAGRVKGRSERKARRQESTKKEVAFRKISVHKRRYFEI